MSSSISLSPNFNNFSETRFSDVAGKFSHDFGVKLHLKADEETNKEQEQEQEEKLINQPEIEDEEEEQNEEESDEEQNEEEPDEEEEQNEEESDDEEEEFSFVCLNPDGSPGSADDLFEDGQIRPVFPLFNQDLLFAYENGSDDGDVTLRSPVRKYFVEDSSNAASSSSDPAGPYCEWRGGKMVTEASPGTCRKSNSTGFSKLWRFRDLKLRCSSDGKDAFVFLSQSAPSTSSEKTEKKIEKEEEKTKAEVSGEKSKVKSGKTASLSAHAKLYVKNRAQREGDKRRSYLPYKQFGFFTNVNGLSRNVHPF